MEGKIPLTRVVLSRGMKRLLILTALLALLVPASAHAASRGAYAKWTLKPSSPTARVHTGTIRFGVSGIPSATFRIAKRKSDSEAVELLTSTGGGDWLTSATPFGRVYGASGPSRTVRYLKIAEDPYGATNRTVTTITFKSAVPAGNLGIAVADLDLDKVVVTAKNSYGETLTGNQLKGTASRVTFNFCNVPSSKPTNCGSDTAVPRWLPGRHGGTVLGSDESSDGASAWLRPNQAIKSLTLTFSAFSGVGVHSYRLWLAVPRSPRFTG